MKANSFRPKRTIALTFVPDEEIGGLTGLAPFLESNEFKSLNVGLAFDEGFILIRILNQFHNYNNLNLTKDKLLQMKSIRRIFYFYSSLSIWFELNL